MSINDSGFGETDLYVWKRWVIRLSDSFCRYIYPLSRHIFAFHKSKAIGLVEAGGFRVYSSTMSCNTCIRKIIQIIQWAHVTAKKTMSSILKTSLPRSRRPQNNHFNHSSAKEDHYSSKMNNSSPKNNIFTPRWIAQSL